MTAPRVASGTKAGVCTSPWASRSVPVRARLSLARVRISNMTWKLEVRARFTLLAMRSAWKMGVSPTVAGVLTAALFAGCGAGGGAGSRDSNTGSAATRSSVTRSSASRSSTGGELTSMPVLGGGRLSQHPPAGLARGSLPGPGTTQHVKSDGAVLTVTLRRVIDPLRASGARLPRHARAVGVIIQIRSAGPATYDSSATGDISVATSGGAVTPLLATHGICRTPLNDFDRYLTAGEDRIGCVVFAVSDGATLDAVRFSPHAHRRGRLTWAP